jgi:hypothetical protein
VPCDLFGKQEPEIPAVATARELLNPPDAPSPKCPGSLECPLKSRVFRWIKRKENFKEFTKNVEKQAKTVGMVGGMKNHKYLKIQELRQ